jgi:hypothetical protein
MGTSTARLGIRGRLICLEVLSKRGSQNEYYKSNMIMTFSSFSFSYWLHGKGKDTRRRQREEDRLRTITGMLISRDTPESLRSRDFGQMNRAELPLSFGPWKLSPANIKFFLIRQTQRSYSASDHNLVTSQVILLSNLHSLRTENIIGSHEMEIDVRNSPCERIFCFLSAFLSFSSQPVPILKPN